MKYFNKFLFFLVLFFSFQTHSISDIPYFIDFKYILNESKAGKEAQVFLKNKLNNGIKNLKSQEKKIQEEEKKIIQQKKLITQEEYKKKVTNLRAKVASLKKERNSLLNDVSKKRAKAKNELLKNLNPIIQVYMDEKKIRMVVDKKSILLADTKLDITQDIIKILDTKLKSIKLN